MQTFASPYERLADHRFSPVRAVTFRGRGGTEIPGYLTLPAGGEARNLPLVLMPHGGPFEVHDAWGFDSDVQFLASRGYGVLQVNYRGSDERGEEFIRSGWKQWGGKLQDDITDGLKYAIEAKLADPNKVCMYGASFGGYSALMQPILNQGMYKCAIGYVGVYDLPLMRRTDIRDGESKRLTRFWDRTLGTDMEALARVSPVTRVGDIKVPVMLVHGRADTTASFNQYKAMEAALRSNGTPAETFVVDAEGHGFVKPENVSELYRRMEQFLDKHIGPGAAPVSATQ